METMNFETIIEDAYISGANKFLNVSDDIDIDCDKPTVYVEYTLEPEVRSWGIKGIYVSINKVSASIEWEVFSDGLTDEDKAALIKSDGTEYRNGNFGGVIELNTKEQEWTIETELTFEDDGALMLSAVSIDLMEKLITIS